jgi:hypothetical protein
MDSGTHTHTWMDGDADFSSVRMVPRGLVLCAFACNVCVAACAYNMHIIGAAFLMHSTVCYIVYILHLLDEYYIAALYEYHYYMLTGWKPW